MSRFDPRYFDRAVLWRYRAGWPGLTTARQTPATYRDRSGVIRTAAPGVLRLDWRDHRPYALVEGASENLIPYDRDISQWSAVNASVDPAGDSWRLTASALPDGAVAGVYITADAAITPGDPVTIRAEVARGNHDYLAVTLNGSTTSMVRHVVVDLRDGAIAYQGGSVGYVRVEPVAGGWEITVHYPEAASTPALRAPAVRLVDGPTSQTMTGDGTEYVLIRRAQCEPGTLATSQIPTDGAPATRDRDLVSVGWAHAPGSCAVLEAGIAGQGASGSARAWQIGSGTGVSQRAYQLIYGSTMMSLRVGSGSAATQSTVPVVPMGAEYLRLALLDVDEATAQARVRLLQRYRETPGSGPWIDAIGSWSAWLDVSALLAQGWESPHLTIGNVREGTRAGRLQLSDMLVLDGREVSVTALTWDRVREWLP